MIFHQFSFSGLQDKVSNKGGLIDSPHPKGDLEGSFLDF